MDVCFRCNQKATLECECSVLLCSDHVNSHLEERKGHTFRQYKPFVMSDLQRTSSKVLISQLKVLDQCSEKIRNNAYFFIQETTKLAEESLKKLQEKRIDLLNGLKLTRKKITDEEISKLHAISDEILVIQNPLISSVHKYLQKHFQADFYQKQVKLHFSDSDQAKKQLIKQYGLFFEGHTDAVFSVAISSNKKLIVSGSGDNTVRVWNLQEKCQELVIVGHTRPINSVAITSDNKFIVSGSSDQTVQVWNLQDKCEEVVFKGHTGSVLTVAITSDNKFIFSSSSDKTIRMWSLQKKCQEAVLKGHTGSVLTIAITSDNKFIVSGSYDKTLQVWNLQNKLQEANLVGHTGPVFIVAITSDNKFIVSGSGDNTVRVWNLQYKRQEVVLEGHASNVKNIAIVNDNKFIVSGSDDNTVRVWNLQKKCQETVLTNRNSASSWIQQYPEIHFFLRFLVD